MNMEYLFLGLTFLIHLINQLKETITIIKKYTNTPICLDSEVAQIRNRKILNDEVILQEGENIRIFFW